jgi:DNA-binding transcriptional regulator YiaG
MMTGAEFKAIRQRLGLTQGELAIVLDYASSVRVSEFERSANPREVPTHVARLMRAYDAGYRPEDWPR